MTPRANTYITDLRHYLDEETGELAADMPAPALRLAMFLASIVAWATSQEGEEGELTNVWCWRSPGRTHCRGEISARLASGSSEIVWQCPLCGVNGVIRGWEGSLWDHRHLPG
jgi:hypothetical protein